MPTEEQEAIVETMDDLMKLANPEFAPQEEIKEDQPADEIVVEDIKPIEDDKTVEINEEPADYEPNLSYTIKGEEKIGRASCRERV